MKVWLCDPWESYVAQLIRDSDEQKREHERELDEERIEELRLEALEADDDWPSYADPIHEIVDAEESEILDHPGDLPVETPTDDTYDDELSIVDQEGDYACLL
jgi:hypothetical protein